MTEEELEQQLVQDGKKLKKPPASVDELLSLIDHVENLLQKVEQSPSTSMLTALDPAREALTAKELLRHSDMDVKVAVTSCISEITRITAPDAPYNDDLMKEIFRMIVVSFEDLFDTSSRSYSKRMSILETVAKVRSCVVMLDLECDDLILEMFQHFLKSTRDTPADKIFSSMETIMTLVLEESEEISQELLSCLLSSVEKEKQDASPVAYKLGEKVIANCAAKLKPYLLVEMQSKGISLDNYTKILASICQGVSDDVEHNDPTASGQQLADEIILPAKTDFDEKIQLPNDEGVKKLESEDVEVHLTVAKSQLGMSNGIVQTGNGSNSSKGKSGNSRRNSRSKKPVIIAQAKSGQATKSKRGRKVRSSLIPSVETSEHSRTANEKESSEIFEKKDSISKDTAVSPLSEGPTIKETSESLDHEKTEVPSLTELHNETITVAAPPNQSPPKSGSGPKRSMPFGRKKARNISTKGGQAATFSESKGLSGDMMEEQAPEIAKTHVKELQDTSNVEVKTRNVSRKHASSTNETLRSDNRNSKKDLSVEKQEDNIMRGKGMHDAEKVVGSIKKRKNSLEKSASKTSTSDQSHLEETSNTKSKRKRGVVMETSATVLDEKLICSRIKVWWPDDEMYYKGVVDSFDPVEKKHKVIYDDGDEEILLLENELWDFVKDDVPDGEQAKDPSNHDASSEMPPKRKAKKNLDSSFTHAKTEEPSKSLGIGAMGGKSKSSGVKSVDKCGGRSNESTPKAGTKSRDGRTIGKSKDNKPKTGSSSLVESPKTDKKSKVDFPKTDTKSKADSPKTDAKSKADSPKTGNKSKADSKIGRKLNVETTAKAKTKLKGDILKGGGKSNTNGASAKEKSGSSSKATKGDDFAKVKLKFEDAQESETKSGTKRRRKAQS